MMIYSPPPALVAPAPDCAGLSIDQMIERYGDMIKRQDADGISALFGTDGEVVNPGAEPIRGATAIRAMLAGFHGATVTSEQMTIGQVVAQGKDWQVAGRFHQTGVNQGKSYDVSGSFDSLWTCAAEGWRVRRMATGK